MIAKDELQILAKCVADMLRLYQKYTQMVMSQQDYDVLLDEMKAIYEASGRNMMIVDLESVFMEDIERRQVNAG